MTLHERHVPVEEARRELDAFLGALETKYQLTDAEYLDLLAGMIQSRLKVHIRHERDRVTRNLPPGAKKVEWTEFDPTPAGEKPCP
jgi:hypothetical protein